MSQSGQHKIAIVGAGTAGTTIAWCCMMQGLGRQIALYDANRTRVEAQVLDLNHGLQYLPTAAVEGSDDIGICADCDVAVLTAGVRQRPGQKREELAAANAEICQKLVPEIVGVAPAAIIIVITSPVDAMTYVASKVSGLSTRRVIGSGMVVDSSRFRYLIAERCRVTPRDVHAFIAGENGGEGVPLWSSAAIASVPLHEWAVPGHGKLTVRDRAEIFENVKEAAQYVIAGKGATSYAIGLGVSQIISAILNDENRVFSVSSMLNDYRGISDVCLSVPSIVNRGGVEGPLPSPMNQAEELGLAENARSAREILRKIGI